MMIIYAKLYKIAIIKKQLGGICLSITFFCHNFAQNLRQSNVKTEDNPQRGTNSKKNF